MSVKRHYADVSMCSCSCSYDTGTGTSNFVEEIWTQTKIRTAEKSRALCTLYNRCKKFSASLIRCCTRTSTHWLLGCSEDVVPNHSLLECIVIRSTIAAKKIYSRSGGRRHLSRDKSGKKESKVPETGQCAPLEGRFAAAVAAAANRRRKKTKRKKEKMRVFSVHTTRRAM